MKKSKIVVLIILIIFLQACSTNNFHRSNNMQLKQKRLSQVIIRDWPRLYTHSEVFVRSVDSILVSCTFFNDSDSDIYLYRPLLPEPSELKYNVFGIIVERMPVLNHNRVVRFLNKMDSVFYEGSGKGGYFVLPSKYVTEYIMLKRKSALTFNSNVALYYDFSTPRKNGFKEFSLSYHVFMPLMREPGQQLWEVDQDSGELKPVYIEISTLPAKEVERYLNSSTLFQIP